MTTIEKPTAPKPSNMNEKNPSLNRGDILPEQESVEMFKIPALGRIATREEYRQSQAEATDAVVDPEKFDRAAETAIRDAEDEEVRNELFAGFTIHDSTRPESAIDEDHDELPEDLKDELGDPDSDDV